METITLPTIHEFLRMVGETGLPYRAATGDLFHGVFDVECNLTNESETIVVPEFRLPSDLVPAGFQNERISRTGAEVLGKMTYGEIRGGYFNRKIGEMADRYDLAVHGLLTASADGPVTSHFIALPRVEQRHLNYHEILCSSRVVEGAGPRHLCVSA